MPRHALGILVVLTLAAAAPAAALEALQPGMKAPDFSLESFEGKAVALHDFARARAIVLVFWASWSDKSRRFSIACRNFTRGRGSLAS